MRARRWGARFGFEKGDSFARKRGRNLLSTQPFRARTLPTKAFRARLVSYGNLPARPLQGHKRRTLARTQQRREASLPCSANEDLAARCLCPCIVCVAEVDKASSGSDKRVSLTQLGRKLNRVGERVNGSLAANDFLVRKPQGSLQQTEDASSEPADPHHVSGRLSTETARHRCVRKCASACA